MIIFEKTIKKTKMSLSGTTDIQNQSGGGLPAWAIAVIIISVILVAVVATVIIVLYTRRNARKRAVKEAKALHQKQLGT